MCNCKCEPRLQHHVFNVTATLESFCVLLGKGRICIYGKRNRNCQPRLQLHVFNTTATWNKLCVLLRKGRIYISSTRCATASVNPDCNYMSSTQLQLGADFVFVGGRGNLHICYQIRNYKCYPDCNYIFSTQLYLGVENLYFYHHAI